MADLSAFCDLPEEILLHILSYLTLTDILNIGPTCRTLFELTNLDVVWRWRFRSNNDHLLNLPKPQHSVSVSECGSGTGSWKKLYVKASYALSFGFRTAGKSGERLCAEFVRNPSQALTNAIRFDHEAPRSMSVEVWIKLDRRKRDGVIIGCQSESISSHRWPTYHWQIMHIGPDGCVRGSLEPYKFMKGPNLYDGQWHHVAITASPDLQKLLVDGKVVDSINFGIGHEFHRHYMTYSQLGNGVISHGLNTPWDSNAMKPGHCGWYPFHGLVREVRIWSGALPDSAVVEHMYVHRIDMVQDLRSFDHKCALIGYWPVNRLVSGPWPWQGSLVSCTSHLEEHQVNSSHLMVIQSHLP